MIFFPVASKRDLKSGFGLQKCFVWSTVNSLQAFKNGNFYIKVLGFWPEVDLESAKPQVPLITESCI